jgi:DNA replication protein DnaC
MPQGHTRTLLHRRGPGHAVLRAQSDNRLDRELAAIGRTPLLVIDELGYVPIDEDGSRLLFQVVTNAYETQSIIYTTNIEFSG